MCGSSDVVTRAATVFAGSVTTLAGDATCVAGSVSWAATTLAGTVVVLAAQWQGLLQCLQDLFQMQRWLQAHCPWCSYGCRVCRTKSPWVLNASWVAGFGSALDEADTFIFQFHVLNSRLWSVFFESIFHFYLCITSVSFHRRTLVLSPYISCSVFCEKSISCKWSLLLGQCWLWIVSCRL